jgi:hypothetical protein
VFREIRQQLEGTGRYQPDASRNERTDLIEWLGSWRAANGLTPTNLKGRSTAQLRKMFVEAQSGKQYRLGRRWKNEG